jgi:hypothetical protein
MMSGGTPTNFDFGQTSGPASAPIPVQTNIDIPEYEQYSPNTYHNPNLDVLSGYGEQLLDPGSDYYQQLLSQMRGDIGQQGAAAKRAAALSAAESGFGAGAGAARLGREGDIDYATQIGMGKGAGQLALAAPGMGASMMQSTFAPQMQEYGLTEQSQQYGHGAAEDARQFGVGVGLQEQGMANEMARFNATYGEQGRQFDDMFQLQQDELALQYGLDPYAGGGYSGGAFG